MIKKALKERIKFYEERINALNEKIKEENEEQKRIELMNKMFGNRISEGRSNIEVYEMLRFTYQMTLQELNDLLTTNKGARK